MLAIPQHLTAFRGESQFTTWVYTFAVNAALVAARRERWKRVPLDHLLENPDLHEGPKRYPIAAQFRTLQNAWRVARFRSKASAVSRAERIYRELGGRDWSLVERLLRAVL